MTESFAQMIEKLNRPEFDKIKGMIETFSIKEEKFIDQKYQLIIRIIRILII